jgi:hypothetical protein
MAHLVDMTSYLCDENNISVDIGGLIFKVDGCDGQAPVVGKGQRDMADSQALGNLQGATGEVKSGAVSGLAADFDFGPCDAMLDTSAQGLGSGLLGGEAGGETLGCCALLVLAVGDFFRSEDAAEESRSISVYGDGDTVDFDHVDAGANEHTCNLNDF